MQPQNILDTRIKMYPACIGLALGLHWACFELRFWRQCRVGNIPVQMIRLAMCRYTAQCTSMHGWKHAGCKFCCMETCWIQAGYMANAPDDQINGYAWPLKNIISLHQQQGWKLDPKRNVISYKTCL